MGMGKNGALVALVGLCLVLPACCGGGTKEVLVPQAQSSTPTLGRELQDLSDAYRKGAITKEEYETGKKLLLEGAAAQ
jgi:hypothetical protein